MAFDGLTLNAISYELKKLIGYKIDKVYEPTNNDIVLGLYGEKTKLALNICIDSRFYRIHLTTHTKPNPTTSPNFCMLLRKHIIGYKIKSIITYGLERAITLQLEPLDESIDKPCKNLVVELMGKHSNIILTDTNNVIIDSLRHTNILGNSYRNIFPKQPYFLPESDKSDFEKIDSFPDFYDIVKNDLQNSSIAETISNKFTGISKSHIEFFMKTLNASDNSKESVEKIFSLLKSVLTEAANCHLTFNAIGKDEDFGVVINETPSSLFPLSFFIDDYYFKKEKTADFIGYRNSILKLILDVLKKYNNRLLKINAKIDECTNMDTYKLYGELLTANLFKYNNDHLDSVTLFNYYENSDIVIPLDKKHTVGENASIYYKKYNKLKNALEYVKKQKEETNLEINYIESIVFELENSSSIEEVQAIFEEISENVIFKERFNKKQTVVTQKNISKKKNKFDYSFSPLQYSIQGYTVFVGRNNKENDWLTIKHASPTDIWFHTKDIHGSHVILKNNGIDSEIPEEILIQCAKLAVSHSKAKNSSNVPVDYCKVQHVKKPNGAKPGMVIYSHNKTLYVTP